MNSVSRISGSQSHMIEKAGRTVLAGMLTASLSLAAVPAASSSAYADEPGDTGSVTTPGDTVTPGDVATPGEGSTVANTVTKKFPMRVNMVKYLPLSGYWSIKNSNKAVVKLNGDGSLKAKKTGKATITCTNHDGTEVRIFKVTVSKSKFKPVSMRKLQCYSEYRSKYMSDAQFKKVYKKALKTVTPAGDLSKKEQLQYVTSALRAYFDNGMSYETGKPHYNDPYGYLCLKYASCAGCARTTKLCLNILGIKAEHVNQNQWKHQWCRVKVGKSYWIADPYGLYCGKEPGVRKHPYL